MTIYAYDNIRSAVLERVGQAIHFNSTLLDLAAHYRFEPRPVAVGKGNEKGRVERAIRYIRDSYFAALRENVFLRIRADECRRKRRHRCSKA